MPLSFAFLHRFRRVLLAICILMWIGAFTATHIPGEDIPEELASLSDIVLHITGFAGLAFWFYLTLAAYGLPRRTRVLTAIFVLALYGAADEYTQQFFHRSMELSDWLCDVTGTLLTVVVLEAVFALCFRKPRRQTDHW